MNWPRKTQPTNQQANQTHAIYHSESRLFQNSHRTFKLWKLEWNSLKCNVYKTMDQAGGLYGAVPKLERRCDQYLDRRIGRNGKGFIITSIVQKKKSTTTRMTLTNIMLNKRGQVNHILHDSIYMNCPETANLETESKLMMAWGWGWKWGLAIKRHKDLLGMMKMF